MRSTPPGTRPPELELAPDSRRPRREEVEHAVAKLGEIYLRRARLSPESVSAREIGLLRRSDWAPLRAAAVVLWSRRRPGSFLRAAERFLRDEAEVRCAVLEGLANAAILEGKGPADPQVAALLRVASLDRDPRVRASAQETALLLAED